MDKLQGSRIVGGNTAYKRRESDFYPTPADVTLALMQQLNLPFDSLIWEPACGKNHIVDELTREGYVNAFGTDILYGDDFLDDNHTCPQGEWIITNPPFSLAEEFIRKAKSLHTPFAFLLKAHFWNAKKRHKLFEECTPSHIYPLTWRPDFLMGTRGGGSPLMDVMWCVWSKDVNVGDTVDIPLKRPALQ